MMRRWSLAMLQSVASLANGPIPSSSKRSSVGILPPTDSQPPRDGTHVGGSDPYGVTGAPTSRPLPQSNLPRRLVRRVSEIFGSAAQATSTHSSRRRSSASRVSKQKPTQRSSMHRNSSETGGRSLVKRRSAIRLELEKEVQLVKNNIRSKKPWRDAFYVVATICTNSLVSVSVASAVMIVFAARSSSSPAVDVASHHADKLLAQHRTERITVAVMFTAVILLGVVITLSFVLSKTSNTRHSGRWVFLRSLWRLIQSAWLVVLLGFALAVSGVELFAWLGWLTSSQAFQRSQLFLLFSINWVCIVHIAKKARRLYIHLASRLRTAVVASSVPSDVSITSHASTVDSSMTMTSSPRSQCNSTVSASTVCIAVPSTNSHTGLPLWRPRRYDVWLPFLSFHVVFAYLAASSTLILCNRVEVIIYSVASVVIKVCLQEAAKYFQLRRCQSLSILLIHAAITAPTIAIDAQIRLVFTQMGVGQSAVSSTIAIVVAKVLFRTAKILRLRHVVASRIARCTGMQRMLQRVHSKIAVRDVVAARAEYAQFLNWKSHVLRLHSSEVYADMHGEYISIGSAMAVLFFLGGHPLYRLSQLHGHVDPALAIRREQLGSAAAQVVLGLLVDYLLSVVETVHEVPLYETIYEDDARLRPFLALLLPVLAAVSVAAMATFFSTPG